MPHTSTGSYACDARVLVGRPKTLQQLASMVATYPRVKGVGVGHSWHGDLFCAGADNSSINIVLTDLDNVLPLYVLNIVVYMGVDTHICVCTACLLHVHTRRTTHRAPPPPPPPPQVHCP